MEDIIKRIVEMDKRAREITDAARQEKLDAGPEIEQKASALREEYLGRARRRAEINGETERTIAEQNWRKRAAVYTKRTEQMQAYYNAHSDELVDQLVARVLEEGAS